MQTPVKRKKKNYLSFISPAKNILITGILLMLRRHSLPVIIYFKKIVPCYFSWPVQKNIWERRIAIIATYAFIKKGCFDETVSIAAILLTDTHPLIHKATGWMLREVGKRNMAIEEKFVQKYHGQMPRTMLRYAIEKWPEQKRKLYLTKPV